MQKPLKTVSEKQHQVLVYKLIIHFFGLLFLLYTVNTFLLRHLLHTVLFVPSSAIRGYNTFILVVLHIGQVPLPCEGKFTKVLPLCVFNAISSIPFNL